MTTTSGETFPGPRAVTQNGMTHCTTCHQSGLAWLVAKSGKRYLATSERDRSPHRPACERRWTANRAAR